MSNKNIINFCDELERFYLSPAMTVDFGLHTGDYQNIYVFLGNNDKSYENPNNEIVMSESSLKEVFKNILLMKKVNLNDIGVVIERIDWEANTVYDYYEAEKNFVDLDANGKLIKKFYVRNRYDQVFKCLWNNTTVLDSYDILSIENKGNYYEITHNGGTFNIGDDVTILKANPSSFNNTYRVINSSLGSVSVAISKSGMLATDYYAEYSGSGKIKTAVHSTVEPMFDTGTFDEEKIIHTDDGYKWKYIYTIDKASKLKFFDNDWMPVPIAINTPNPVSSKYGYGSIDTINIVNPGKNYQDNVGTILINIDGDGYGANAESLVLGGELTQITIKNPGKNYTWANVSLTSLTPYGSDAEIQYTISPIGGHGFNPARELYARNLIITGAINEDENGAIPFDFTFNQVGVLYNPYIISDETNHANSTFISKIITINVSPGQNKFVPDEFVTQTDIYGKTLFVGKTVAFDETNNILRVINNQGIITESVEIVGKTSSTSRTVISSANSINEQLIYTPFSGNIFYLENKEPRLKSEKGIELVKILLSYAQ